MATRNAPNGPWVIQANQHSSEVLRQLVQSIFASPGVINSSDLAVSALGTPNMSVNVAAGFAVVAGSEVSNTQGSYHVYNDATVNLAIAAADPTNPRVDIVVAAVQDAAYSGAANQWVLQVVTGTPAPSPSAPAAPANSLTLAQISVAANASSIASGAITDVRQRAILLGEPTKYRARMSQASAQSIANSSTIIVAFDTKTYDTNGNLTTGASAAYTCPVAGYYQVNGVVYMNSPITGTVAQIKHNGSFILGTAGGTIQASSVSDVVYCQAGDTLQLAVFQNSGGAVNTFANRSFLSVHLLSFA